MTPTFSGCPAMDVMQQDVADVLNKHGIHNQEVRVTFETQWNSNLISEKGEKCWPNLDWLLHQNTTWWLTSILLKELIVLNAVVIIQR